LEDDYPSCNCIKNVYTHLALVPWIVFVGVPLLNSILRVFMSKTARLNNKPPGIHDLSAKREFINLGEKQQPLFIVSFSQKFKKNNPMSGIILLIYNSWRELFRSCSWHGLGRALKKVLIIDSGNPCNRQTPYSNNS